MSDKELNKENKQVVRASLSVQLCLLLIVLVVCLSAVLIVAVPFVFMGFLFSVIFSLFKRTKKKQPINIVSSVVNNYPFSKSKEKNEINK